jgi:hypothetical protein
MSNDLLYHVKVHAFGHVASAAFAKARLRSAHPIDTSYRQFPQFFELHSLNSSFHLKGIMDDPSPPPYSVHDPQSPNSASRSYVPEDTQSFNLSIGAASSFALHHGISVGQSSPFPLLQVGTSRGSVSPILTTTPSSHSTATIDELSKSGLVSAIPYFELRSKTQPKPADTVFHHMIITPDAGPDHLPFPQPSAKWLKREVDSHDWITFINHIQYFLVMASRILHRGSWGLMQN